MKQKWTKLEYSDLAKVLAKDEIDKLNEMSLDESIEDICQAQLDSVADSYRASFAAKGYAIDIRDQYLPSGYHLYALSLARYFICTRFPGSLDTFLDEPRKALFEKAQELLENPILGVPEPDYSDDPELSANSYVQADAALTIPYQRFVSQAGQSGFPGAYKEYYQTGIIW